jgi:hypothetical protein
MTSWLIWAAVIFGIMSIVTQRVLRAPVGLIGATSYSDAIRQGRIVEAGMRFTFQFVQGLVWFFFNVLYWPLTIIRRFVIWVCKTYYRFWRWFVIGKDGYSSKQRAGLLVTATVLVSAVAGSLSLTMLEFTGDTFKYVFFADEEIVFLHNTHLGEKGKYHTIDGSYTYPSSPETSLYYVVEDDLFSNIWSIIKHGHLFYPDGVASSVPPVPSRCKIVSFGVRQKFWVQRVQWYPQMLYATCCPDQHVCPSVGEIKQASIPQRYLVEGKPAFGLKE